MSKFRPFSGVRKNIKLIEHKHVIYHFKARDIDIKNIYNFLREIFKFLDFKKAFMNFAKSIIAHIFVIFNYFTKRTIYSDSPDHVLQNDMQHI